MARERDRQTKNQRGELPLRLRGAGVSNTAEFNEGGSLMKTFSE